MEPRDAAREASVDNYKKFIQDALTELTGMLKSNLKVCIYEVKENDKAKKLAYCKKLFIDSHCFLIGIDLKGEDPNQRLNWLMRNAIDRIALVLGQRHITFDRTKFWYFDRRTKQVFTEKQLAEYLYSDIQRFIFSIFRESFGIDLSLIAEISAMPYEGDKPHGKFMLFPEITESDFRNFLIRVEQNTPITFSSHSTIEKTAHEKQIRKLLAGVGDDTALVFGGSKNDYPFQGFAKADPRCPFFIKIDGEKWSVWCCGVVWFSCEYDHPAEWHDPEEELKNINRKLMDWFNSEKGYYDLLYDASIQKHGTSLILMKFDEITRAYMNNLVTHRRAFSVADLHNLPKGFITNLARIDGAIVIDADSQQLKYFSTNVDGIACIQGDLGRGARHNGLKAFAANLKKMGKDNESDITAAVVIFSEDGGAEIVLSSDIEVSEDADVFFNFEGRTS